MLLPYPYCGKWSYRVAEGARRAKGLPKAAGRRRGLGAAAPRRVGSSRVRMEAQRKSRDRERWAATSALTIKIFSWKKGRRIRAEASGQRAASGRATPVKFAIAAAGNARKRHAP